MHLHCSPPARLGGLLLLFATSLLATSAKAATYTVGSGETCDASTLGEALVYSFVNPGTDVIRVTRDQTYSSQAIVVSNQSVTIRGGYDDCDDTTASGSTTLDGTGGASAAVLTIQNDPGSTAMVNLEDLTVRGGEDGGIRVAGQVLVQIFNVLITDNDADEGGGLALDGTSGGAVVLDDASRVLGNRAVFSGGGLYCTGAGTIGSRAALRDNDSDFNGGGVAAENDCIVNLFPSAFPGHDLGSNDADFNGGAVHASSGAEVHLIGNVGEPIEVRSNRALFGFGGAVYATGVGTLVTATDARIAQNSAEDGGGAIAVTAGARFEMERSASCTLGLDCSVISNNLIFDTATNGSGGALYVWDGGVAEVHGTHLFQNSSDGPGRVARIVGASSRLELEGSVVRYNPSSAVSETFQADGGGQLLIGFSTFADNLASAGHVLFRGTTGAVVGLYSSVVAESTGQVFAVSSATLDADCVLAHETATFPPGASRTGPPTAASVLVREPTGLDLHLTDDSPAIDYCNDSVWSPETLDFDGQERGVDRVGTPSVWGLFDLGADEVHGEANPLFADGFESGDVSAWGD